MRRQKGFTLGQLVIVLAGVAILGTVFFGNLRSDWTYSRTVAGEVVTQGSRFGAVASGSERSQQKIAIKLHPVQADDTVKDVAGGPSGVSIECLSTRCATIQAGECHRFECKLIKRWTEPSIIECKHAKEVECSTVSQE